MRPVTLSSYSRLKMAESSAIRFSAASSSFFFAAFALLAQLLHTLPCVLVDYLLVVVLKDCLFVLAVVDNLAAFIGLCGGLEVHKAACVFLVFKDMHHGVHAHLHS
jgi:hypothetical protein